MVAMQTTTRTKVAVSGLSKRFDRVSPPLLALDDVSLALAEGELCTVVGPSGCGKTTLLRILAGLERPTSGSARVLDQQRRLPAAVVFQGRSLYPWLTVLDNVAYPLQVARVGRGERRAAALAALDQVKLAGFARAYPHHLSEGMRQRVAIARALVADADLLLLDEPFSALDEPTRLLLQEEVQDLLLRSGRTALFVTHSIDEAVLLGDRVVVFSARPGRISQQFAVPFARPRAFAGVRRDPRFGELVAAIWETLRAEVERAGGAR